MRISVPYEDDPAQCGGLESRVMLDGSTLKIMLLDDEPIMLNLHARILKNQG